VGSSCQTGPRRLQFLSLHGDFGTGQACLLHGLRAGMVRLRHLTPLALRCPWLASGQEGAEEHCEDEDDEARHGG